MYSAVYLRIQKWKNYWNRSTFAKVIVKIKVARFLWPTVYLQYYCIFTCSISHCLVAFWPLFLNEYEWMNEWLKRINCAVFLRRGVYTVARGQWLEYCNAITVIRSVFNCSATVRRERYWSGVDIDLQAPGIKSPVIPLLNLLSRRQWIGLVLSVALRC